MSGDLRRDVKMLVDHLKRARSDEDESQWSVNNVWSETQQLPLSVELPSDRDLTSSWRKAAGCGREVMGSDPSAGAVGKMRTWQFFDQSWEIVSVELVERATVVMGIHFSSIRSDRLDRRSEIWVQRFSTFHQNQTDVTCWKESFGICSFFHLY